MDTTKSEKKKRGGKAKVVIIVIVAILLVLALAVFLIFHHYYGLMEYQPGGQFEIADYVEDTELTDEPDSDQAEIDALEEQIRANMEAEATEPISDSNVLNILLIGTDSDSNEGVSRSDSMILVSFNKDTSEIVMTSFLRDIYLNIPGVGNNRLNAAYAYGGPDLLIQTLESNFGVEIDRYMQVNFTAYKNVINQLGGVTLELTDEEVSHLKQMGLEINSTSGNSYHLDGDAALAYARIRKLDSDFGRTERQRKVLSAIFQETGSLSLTSMNSLLNTILPQVMTDITEGEAISIVLSAVSYSSYDLVTSRIPVDGSWNNLTINSMAVLGIDFAENRQVLTDTIYGD